MIDINCDVGEGTGNEHLLFPYISSCNIACGGHAGDTESMRSILQLAKRHHINVGAHPSYPDRANFGRKSMTLSADELSTSIFGQIKGLQQLAHEFGLTLHHIKPHGALYHDVCQKEEVAGIFLEAIEEFRTSCKLCVPGHSRIAQLALDKGFDVCSEVFADRNYNEDLSLVNRTAINALITDPTVAAEHVENMISKKQVRTKSGKFVPIQGQTYCVHSDTKNSVDIVRHLYLKYGRIYTLTFKPFGASALLIEWPEQMNESILRDVLAFKETIEQAAIEGINELVPSIHSITVIVDSTIQDFALLIKELQALYNSRSEPFELPQTVWKIPVCYDESFGSDIKELAESHSLSKEEVVQLHTKSNYRIYAIGFLPGFLYLGGLDEQLHTDRKETPRLSVPRGAVGIGGSQTGIYPCESPGGWHLIGNSPLNFFDQTSDQPCFAYAGERIQFYAISQDEYNEIKKQVESGQYRLRKEESDD